MVGKKVHDKPNSASMIYICTANEKAYQNLFRMDKKTQKPRTTRTYLRTMPLEQSSGYTPHKSKRYGWQPFRRKRLHRELDGFVSSMPQSSGVHRAGKQGSTNTPARKVDAQLIEAQIGLPLVIVGLILWLILLIFYAN